MTLLEKIDIAVKRGLLRFLKESFEEDNETGDYCFESECTNPESQHYNVECVSNPKAIVGKHCETCGFPVKQWNPIDKGDVEYANAHLDKKLPTLKSNDPDREEKKLGVKPSLVTNHGDFARK